jgi:osmotically inducible lipoprotein OsmB
LPEKSYSQISVRPIAADAADAKNRSANRYYRIELATTVLLRREKLPDTLFLKGRIMKTVHNILISTVTLTLLVSLTGCGGMSRRGADTAVGAGVGGVAGAVLTGGSAAGTVGGAVVGGVIGNQVGK